MSNNKSNVQSVPKAEEKKTWNFSLVTTEYITIDEIVKIFKIKS